MSNHIIITGTGRAATTFLVQLLTLLGFDTGFTDKDFATLIHPISLGGLEHDIRRSGKKPYIIKNPWICDQIEEIMANPKIVIDHVFIPIRSIYDAAESRRRVSNMGIAEGGLWDVSFETYDQERALLYKFHNLLLHLSRKNIPVTFIQFPKIVKNSLYLCTKLNPLFRLCKRYISYNDFAKQFDLLVNKQLIDVK